MPTIETGHPVTEDVKQIDAKKVRFVADDGKAMFEVGWNSDGVSINIRGSQCCMVDGKLRCDRFVVIPLASNSIDVKAPLYEEHS